MIKEVRYGPAAVTHFVIPAILEVEIGRVEI
jgi:hypothetical protein